MLLWATVLCGQSAQPLSEKERIADLKQRVIAAIPVQAGGTVADVGCGVGFYTIPLAHFLGPSGKVFAEDIDSDSLGTLKQALSDEGLRNVEIVKGLVDDPRLPDDSLDAVLIVNSYHEMTAHEAMLRHIRAALKQTGVLVLMEGISERWVNASRDEQAKHHQLGPQPVKQEVESAGFEVKEIRDPFIERARDDEDGNSRWWILIARKTAK